MSIKINNADIRIARETIKFRKFPELYDAFLGATKNTRKIEKEGAALMKARTFSDARAYQFVLSVLEWGGPTGARIVGNFDNYYGDKKQTQKALAKSIRHTILSLKDETCADAIRTITNDKGFGFPYGSKILRMLAPQKAVVYDNQLDDKLQHGWNKTAYQEFCDSCVSVAAVLNKSKIGARRWKAADVEAVIFARLVRGF